MVVLNHDGPVLVAGDWHGNLFHAGEIIHRAELVGCGLIVHVGDIGFLRPRSLETVELFLDGTGTQLLWVDGNHEDHDLIAGLPHDEHGLGVVHEHIRHLPRGTAFRAADMTWLAMGGASSIDRSLRTPGDDWWPGESITESDVQHAVKVADQVGPVDVLVTHEAPTGAMHPTHEIARLEARADRQGWPPWPTEDVKASLRQRELVQELMVAVRPDVLFHGHHHFRYAEQVEFPDGGSVRVEGLGADVSKVFSDSFAVVQPASR